MIAPFLALAVDLNAGLAVMGCGLLATTYLAVDAARGVAGVQHHRLLLAAALNGVLAIACVALLVARLWI